MGQIDLEQYLVIGDPVAHSKSPEMQNAGLAALGLPERYGKRRVAAEDLADFVAYARRALRGFNITVPHKRAILPFLDEIAPEAELAGSVNTVTVGADGRLRGDSTDGYGLAAALYESFVLPIRGTRFVFIGAGGAAQATSVHFALEGAASIAIFNRTRQRADDLAATLLRANPGLAVTTGAISDSAAIRAAIRAADAVIQATSLGLRADDAPPFDLACLEDNPRISGFETIYRPTPFFRHLADRNRPVADGRGMLLHQGAKSLELWTGRPAPVEAMRMALKEALTVC